MKTFSLKNISPEGGIWRGDGGLAMQIEALSPGRNEIIPNEKVYYEAA